MMDKSKAKLPQNKNCKAADPRTLFVKFYPPSATITRQHLSDHFSHYGPVNRCSVIRQTKKPNTHEEGVIDDDNNDVSKDRGSKGYGFVRFVHEDDAKAAADAIRKKSSQGDKKKGEIMTVDGVQYRIHAERAVDAASSEAVSKSKKGTDKQHKDANVEGKDESGTTAATSLSAEDAAALAKRKRSSRVIIRNLSFYANEKHIKTVMESEFGPVVAIDLPLVPTLPNNNGDNKKGSRGGSNVSRHRGFAFVTFANASSAKNAVERGNEIKIKNRMVAIDFSISKVVHQQMMKQEQKKEQEKDEEGSDDGKNSVDGSKSGDDSREGSGGDEESDASSVDSKADSDNDDSGSDDDDDDSESSSDSENSDAEADEDDANKNKGNLKDKATAPKFDESESRRTLFLRNIPFDATRHDVFELFREFGRIEAVYLVKDPQTGVFRGTAFVRFEKESACNSALEASGFPSTEDGEESSNFVSSKNMTMGLGDGAMSGLSLKGRHILVDLAVDRSTASSLAVQRDADGKPIKKMIGKDRRNLYLKNEGRVSSSADGAAASTAGAKHGGVWEDLPQSDRAKRERAFADKSTKLRSPLFFINPTRLSIRNLAKHVNEADLKRLVTQALQTGLEQKLVMPNDAVAHWRAGGELAHSEVMRRATDASLVTPPYDEKNTKESIPSVFIDRDTSGGKKTADAPSKGFGFVEFTHHTHALACLRQLNNNPAYSAEFAAGGKHASELAKQQQRRGKKHKKAKIDESGAEFVGEDGKICVPRLIVEFAVSSPVFRCVCMVLLQSQLTLHCFVYPLRLRTRLKQDSKLKRLPKSRYDELMQQCQQCSFKLSIPSVTNVFSLVQYQANKIKQKIENKEKMQQPEKKEAKKSRGALQREKKRARKEAEEDSAVNKDESDSKPKTDSGDSKREKVKAPKLAKPHKKRKVDADEDRLEYMIQSYKASFSQGVDKAVSVQESNEPKKKSRESVAKRRWFE